MSRVDFFPEGHIPSAHGSVGRSLAIASDLPPLIDQTISTEPVALIDASTIAKRDSFETLSLLAAIQTEPNFQNQPIAGAAA